MEIENPTFSYSGQEYRDNDRNVPRDPYDYENAFYRAAMSLGYVVVFDTPALDLYDTDISDRYFRLRFDTEETDTIVGSLCSFIGDQPRTKILHAVSLSKPEEIFWQISGTRSLPRNVDRRVVEECFLRAMERHFERMDERERYLLRWYGTSYLGDDCCALYDALNEKGVRPITPEAMALILRGYMSEIILRKPKLAPQSQHLDGLITW